MAGRASIRTGLRVRIAATIAGIVLLAVTGLGLAVHQLVVLDRIDQARSSADQQLRAALEIYDRTGLLSFDAKVDDQSVPAVLRASLTRDGSRGTLVKGGGVRVVWAAGRTGDTVLSTRTTLHAVDASVRAVDRALLLAGGATVLVAALVGLLSANQLARRLRTAARTARDVASGGDPQSLRVAVGQRRDEVGDLADAVDAMAARLNARLQGEQRFTADVAHDLRTPVTGLITAAALLGDSRPAELVRDRAAALAMLIEELLEVSRLDSGNERASMEAVDLGAVVVRAVHRGAASGEYDEDQVLARTDETPVTVWTDPRRLARVLSNLTRNALQHGEPPVEVVQHGSRVTVRDHGNGFDEALLLDGPQRFRRTNRNSAGGNGLGLVIATGQAFVLGATIGFANAESGGAVVTIVLPGDGTSRAGHEKVPET